MLTKNKMKKPYLAIVYLDGTYSFEEVGQKVPPNAEFFKVVHLTDAQRDDIITMNDQEFQEQMESFLSQANCCN
jgi:hypothetical protein